MKTCIVTGSSGYVGRALVGSLVAESRWESIALLDRTGPPWLHPSDPRITSYHVSLDEPAETTTALSEIGSMSEVAVVFHLAGLFVRDFADRSRTEPDSYYRDNVRGTTSLMQALERAGFSGRIVVLSTALGYLSEDAVSDDPYARTKLAAEGMCLRSNLDTVVIRSARIVGITTEPGNRVAYHASALSRTVVHDRLVSLRSRHRLPVDIVSDLVVRGTDANTTRLQLEGGRLRRTYVHVNDLTRALIAASRCSTESERILSFGACDSISLSGLCGVVTEGLASYGLAVEIEAVGGDANDVVFQDPSQELLSSLHVRTSRQVIADATTEYLCSALEESSLEVTHASP